MADSIQLAGGWAMHLPPLSPKEEEENDIKNALETLTRIVQVLDIPDASFASYSTALMNMSAQHFLLSRSLNRFQQLEDELKDHLASLQHEYRLIKHWNTELTPGSSGSSFLEPVSTLERRKEVVVKKAKEYHRELEDLIANEPLALPISPSLSDLIAQKEKNIAKEHELKEKRAKIKTFQGLPPNMELARHELRLARQHQTELMKLRERLLRSMADGVE